MMNILNGGAHADNSVDLQEFMVVPVGARTSPRRCAWARRRSTRSRPCLKEKKYSTGVGDEGGFAPRLASNQEAVELILVAIERAGYQPGRQIALALDPAASEFYENGEYVFRKSDGSRRSSAAMVEFYRDWVRRYPIVSIEDGLSEDDWDGWADADPRARPQDPTRR